MNSDAEKQQATDAALRLLWPRRNPFATLWQMVVYVSFYGFLTEVVPATLDVWIAAVAPFVQAHTAAIMGGASLLTVGIVSVVSSIQAGNAKAEAWRRMQQERDAAQAAQAALTRAVNCVTPAPLARGEQQVRETILTLVNRLTNKT